MRYFTIIIVALLLSCCSTSRSVVNKKESLQLHVNDITKQKESYLLATTDKAGKNILVVVPNDDFRKSNISSNKSYTFELKKMRVSVPHMQDLMNSTNTFISFGSDTICRGVEECSSITVYLFQTLK